MKTRAQERITLERMLNEWADAFDRGRTADLENIEKEIRERGISFGQPAATDKAYMVIHRDKSRLNVVIRRR